MFCEREMKLNIDDTGCYPYAQCQLFSFRLETEASSYCLIQGLVAFIWELFSVVQISKDQVMEGPIGRKGESPKLVERVMLQLNGFKNFAVL